MSQYLSNINDVINAYDSAFADFVVGEPDAAIIMPPPNVTGSLHIGHALNLFMQDLFVRFYKLHNTTISWIPGTDHAGIAVPLLVRKQNPNIAADQFEKELWKWKDISEQNILKQLQKMRLLLDWPKYRFSLDSGAQEAVTTAFCKLYEKGLIFRDKRMVNWDIELQTVISDIETCNKEVDGKLWYIKYESVDGGIIEVATTRPETIFADEAICVHPDDARFTPMIGKLFKVPLTNKLVPLIADPRCDIDKGSGVVKIDPAHGFLDLEIAATYNLPVRTIIDKQGKMCGDVPAWVNGIDRFAARDMVAMKLTEYITKVEVIKHYVPHGIRSDSVLEPIVTDQWFFDMPKLADRARAVITDDVIQLLPSRFKDIYMQYINNLQPWCISRQISWGHRIPVWYCEDKIHVAQSIEDVIAKVGNVELKQDPDVLDTWFSSALWPMITLGWPNSTDLMTKLYPNQFLITGSDILFFWVTKMIMMDIGLNDNPTGPFKSVVLHGLVQDENGLKMSKSKGNVVDPLELLEVYGRDILGFALLSSSPAGQNIKFGQSNIEKSQKFLNKIWNALNFCLGLASNTKCEIIHPVNLWILTKTQAISELINEKLSNWLSYEACNLIYDFFWNEFCSWYIEVSKYLVSTAHAEETKYTIYLAVTQLLKLMHPFLPQVTEYFWQKFMKKSNILSSDLDKYLVRSDIGFDSIQQVINQLRSLKKQFSIKSDSVISMSATISIEYIRIISHLTKHKISIVDYFNSQDSIKFGCCGHIFTITKADCEVSDIPATFRAIMREIKSQIDLLESKLNDAGFMQHASQEDIAQKRRRLSELQADSATYTSAYEPYCQSI